MAHCMSYPISSDSTYELAYWEAKTVWAQTIGFPICQLVCGVRTDWIAHTMCHRPTIVPYSPVHLFRDLVRRVKPNLNTIVVVRRVAAVDVDLQEIGATAGHSATGGGGAGRYLLCSSWRRVPNSLAIL